MSYKGGHSDYRGRGREASKRYQPRHSKKHLSEEEQERLVQPYDADAIRSRADEGTKGFYQADAQENGWVFEDAEYDDSEPQDAPEVSEDEAAPRADAEMPVEENEPVEEYVVEPVEDGSFAYAAAAPTVAAGALEEGDLKQLTRYGRDDTRYTQHRKGGGHFSRGQKRAIIIVAIVAALLSACAGVALAYWQNAQSNIALEDQTIKDNLAVTESTEPYWTLVLGSDSRHNKQQDSRSDVIILARIDQNSKQVTLVSIPRDTKVTINGKTQKINAAFALGGAKQAIETIGDYAGVNITHYVEIYFDGFSDLVDQMGGVTVDVPERASYHGVTIQPGEQTLNGKQALTLARNRKTYADGDFTRTKCQRLLAQALLTKLLQQDVTQLPGTVTQLSKCFSTDIPLQDLINMALSLQGMGSDKIYMAMAPSTTGMLGRASYTFTCINQWKLLMQKANAGDDPKLTKKEQKICGTESTKTADLDMAAGLPEDVSAELQEYWDKQAEKAKEKELKEQQGSQGSQEAQEPKEPSTPPTPTESS